MLYCHFNHQRRVITHSERRGEVGNPTQLPDHPSGKTLAQVQVVKSEPATAEPILFERPGRNSRERVNEPGAISSELAERSGNRVVLII